MTGERSLREEVRATMAELAAACEKGQRERLASLLAPEARLYVTDAKGTEEYVGAAAASHKLGGYRGLARSQLNLEKAVVLQEGGAAFVGARLEGQGGARAAAAPARLTAELERHGEQWRVKEMHYRAE